MKKLHRLFIVLALVFTGTLAKAQKTVIKANLLSPVVSTGSFFVEHAISETSSLQLGGFYTGASVGDTKFRGFGITPEFRYYLSDREAPAGFYLGPFLRYQNFTLTYDSDDSEADLTTFGGGVLVGNQWIFKERIALDIFAGPSYNAGSLEAKDGANEDNFETGTFDGFGFRFGVALGIAF
ncbi:MAG: DUF3575 domain-containing protein [Flammeovirgaceae bacterium]